MFCREQVAQLRLEVDEIHARGAELVVVGNGNRHFAQAFREDMGLTTPLYVDTKRDTYRALGMKRGVLRTLSFGTLKNALRARRAGARQERIQGDPWQMGGILVVLPGGKIAYRYLSESPGDHPPLADVFKALPAR
jgi:hypothetical protein